MSEETQAEVQGQEDEKLEQLDKWLRLPHHSKAIIMAMALRAALRTLPIINLGQYLPASRIALNYPKKVASAFRATAIAKIIAKFPDLALDLRGGILSAAADAKTPNIVFPGDTPINYFFAAMRAASLAALTSEKKFNQLDVYRASLLALSNPSFLATDINFMFWNAIDEDVKLVNSGVTARQLVNTKLWHGAPPAEIMNQWENLCDGLPEEDNWSVWKRWYEENFYGIDLGGDHDLSFATCPEEKWHKGPAAANAWIAKRLAELEKNTSSSDIHLDDFPKPLENVPSLFTFGLNDAGQIDVVAGPQNTPVIGFAGDEKTHRQWLETARELARRLADDMRDNKFGNVRRDYADGLFRYAGDLPIAAGEGNFLLADHEIIAIHDLFGAEAAIVPEALAARLNSVLRAHYSLLDFYPETKRYHEAAQKGRLGPPAPEEAFAGFENVVREFTPEIFAPRVTQELEAANYEAARVEIDEEDRKLHAAIEPAKYPYEHDRLQERRYSIASLANALSKALWTLAKDPEKAIAYGLLLDKLSPDWSVIKQYLLVLFN